MQIALLALSLFRYLRHELSGYRLPLLHVHRFLGYVPELPASRQGNPRLMSPI